MLVSLIGCDEANSLLETTNRLRLLQWEGLAAAREKEHCWGDAHGHPSKIQDPVQMSSPLRSLLDLSGDRKPTGSTQEGQKSYLPPPAVRPPPAPPLAELKREPAGPAEM